MKWDIYLTPVNVEIGRDVHAGISFSNSIAYPIYSGSTLCGEKGILRRADGAPTCKRCTANAARRTARIRKMH